MIAGWMIYGIAVSALLGLAALATEAALLRWHAPTRFAWAASLAGLFLVPAVPLVSGWLGRAGASGSIAPAVDMGEMTMVTGVDPSIAAAIWLRLPGDLQAWDPVLTYGWLLLSTAVILFFAISHAAFRRQRREWRERAIEGRRALVSRITGPAVFGFFPGEIVLPEWVEQLPEGQREMLIRHEAEHIRARDPLLLLFALLVVAAIPWNVAAWWQLRRLRGAIEVDCDRRVVGKTDAIGTYGSLLLEVALRSNPIPMPAAAFGAHTPQLERRVRIMTRGIERYRRSIAAGALAIAGAVLLVACQIEQPLGPMPRTDAETPVLAEGVDLSAEPVFTPMQVRPQLTNRAEFGEALEQRYPPMLKDAGIGGTVTMWAFIDENGIVRNTRIVEGTGQQPLDEVATSLMREVARFTPASNNGTVVPVWVQLPITFRTTTAAGADRPAQPASSPMAERLESDRRVNGSPDPPASEIRVIESRSGGEATALPPGANARLSDEPVFTPMENRPQLQNRTEFAERLIQLYPTDLKDRGIGGTTTLWVFIDEEGVVRNTRVTQSSGESSLDQAAETAIREARFTPATNRDASVPVWVQLPVSFQPTGYIISVPGRVLAP